MALFKIYKGAESVLQTKALHEGYAYFCSDTGNFFIDAVSSNGLERIQINAKTAESAAKLVKDTKTVEIDDIFLKDMVATVAQGGTGQSELAANALLVGNGTDGVKLVPTASGALYATGDNGEAQFGTLPIEQGGTGAPTEAEARDNLDVYSKAEVDQQQATTYTYTLGTGSWAAKGSSYIYELSIPTLRCGAGNKEVPPIITCVKGDEGYAQIVSAEATKGVGITFTAIATPTVGITIKVIDLY